MLLAISIFLPRIFHEIHILYVTTSFHRSHLQVTIFRRHFFYLFTRPFELVTIQIQIVEEPHVSTVTSLCKNTKYSDFGEKLYGFFQAVER